MVNVFNTSCIGASHLKAGKPCQDFSLSWNSGVSAIIAVADGHGSEEHFRSGRGSRFAAEAAVQCIKELILLKTDRLHDPDAALEALEKSIIAVWYEKIANDVQGDPIDGDAVSPYGTTLLAAAMTGHYWFAIQIGDGKCVVIDGGGNAAQPVPWDDRCFLNWTTSLCDEDAVRNFRHFYSEAQPSADKLPSAGELLSAGELPSAIFLGSDGIDDSFPLNENDEHLAGFYRNVFNNFINEGLHNGKKQLKEMLPLLTQKGSGDDVSVAGIIRISVNKRKPSWSKTLVNITRQELEDVLSYVDNSGKLHWLIGSSDLEKGARFKNIDCRRLGIMLVENADSGKYIIDLDGGGWESYETIDALVEAGWVLD